MSLSDNIEVFLAVVQTASISEAAKLLFVSQSTISYRLKLLEDELECRLIDRVRGQGHCELTREGQSFLLIAEKTRNIQHEIARFKNDSKVPTLRIGSAESIACYLLDTLLEPDKMRLEYTLGGTDSIYKMMASGQLDAGYVIYFKKVDGLKIRPIYSEEMVVCATPGMFEPGIVIEPENLNFDRFVEFNWTETRLRSWVDHWRDNKSGLYFTTNAPCMAVRFMQSHHAWSLMPESMARRISTDMQMETYKLTEPPPDRVCYRLEPVSGRFHNKEMLKIWDEKMDRYIRSLDYLKVL